MFELNPSKTVNDTGSACAVPVSVGTRLPGNDWSERKELVMKNASLMVVAVALLVGGCLREEALPELVMVDGIVDQPALLKFDPEELLAKQPTAAGMPGEPL